MACDGCAHRDVQRMALGLVIKHGFHVSEGNETLIKFIVKKEALEKICSRTFSHAEWLDIQAEFFNDPCSWHRDCDKVSDELRFTVNYVLNQFQSLVKTAVPVRCSQCHMLDKVNYQLATIIGHEVDKFMSDAIFLNVKVARLEKFYYENFRVPTPEEEENSHMTVMTGPFTFTKDDRVAIAKLWNGKGFQKEFNYHLLTDPEDTNMRLKDTLWKALGIPVQVLWDRTFFGIQIYNLRILDTPCHELTLEHLREAIWAEIGDELTSLGWRIDELWFSTHRRPAHCLTRDEIRDDDGWETIVVVDDDCEEFQNLILDGAQTFRLDLMAIWMDNDTDEEEDEEEEEEEDVINVHLNNQYMNVSQFPYDYGLHYTTVRDVIMNVLVGAGARGWVDEPWVNDHSIDPLSLFCLMYHHPHLDCFLMARPDTTLADIPFDFSEEMELFIQYEPEFELKVKVVGETVVKVVKSRILESFTDIKEKLVAMYNDVGMDSYFIYKDNVIEYENKSLLAYDFHEDDTLLLKIRSRNGGGQKRKYEDKQAENWEKASKLADDFSGQNQFYPLVSDLYQKINSGEAKVLENLVNTMPSAMLDKLEEAYYSSGKTSIEKCVDNFWHSFPWHSFPIIFWLFGRPRMM